jgi:SAM-dependent methyltransferase
MSLEQHVEGTASPLYDGAVLINVLEHIKDDQLALSEIGKGLKPGGCLLLFVPALNMLYSKFDKKIGHYRRYQKNELGSLVSNAGFKVISNYYCDILGVFPWLVLNKIFGRTKLDPNMIKLYDNVGVPLTRAIEKMLVPPFGKNLILVARRSDDNRLAV